MNKLYTRIVWENFPSEKTALNESNLNRMDLAIDNIDNRVIEMDSTKVNKEVANNLVKTWSIDEETGIITVVHLDGSKDLFDLNIEKIPVDFKLSDDGILTMTTDDGTQYTANIGAMIPVLTFEDSEEIAVSVTGTGANKTYSFSIKSGSVTEDKLQPNFLADIKTEVAKAQASQSAAAQSASAASSSATLAESYTHGGTGARDGEDADNARYYMEQAKAVSAVNVATTETAGIVKPDGDTITVDPDGTIHGQSKVSEMAGATAEANGTSGTVPAPTAGQENHVLKGNGTWEPLVYDSELSAESENAPQTKVVDAKTKEIEENLSQLSNPNLLINPDFKINQRGGKIALVGTAFYDSEDCTTYLGTIDATYKVERLANGNYKFLNVHGDSIYIKASDVVDGYCAAGYTVDRWRSYYDGLTVKLYDDHIELINDTDENKFFGQMAELNLFKSLYGKSLTASIEAESALGTSIFYSGYVKDNVYNVLYSVEINKERSILSQTFTVNETDCSKYEICTIQILSHDTVKIYNVKLELGSVATPFVPPDPATELLKCQRYYKKYTRLPVLRNKQGSEHFGPSAPDIFRMSPDIDGWSSDINNIYTASVLGNPDIEIKIVGRAGNGSLSNGVMLWFRIVNSDGSNIESTVTSLEIFNIALDAEIY